MKFHKTILRAPALNDLPAEFLRMQKSEGLRRLYWPEQRLQQEVESLIENVWDAFYSEIMGSLHPPIKGFFCFDPGECGGAYAGDDGICVWMGEPTAFYIGLASNILQSEEQTLNVLIHELAHVLAFDPYSGGHSPHYEAKLDLMLTQFNARHGTALENDYVTFNDE